MKQFHFTQYKRVSGVSTSCINMAANVMLITIALLVILTSCVQCTQFKGGRSSLDGSVSLSWIVDENAKTVTINGVYKTKGWVSVGIDNKNMGDKIKSALYVIQWDSSNRPYLRRYVGSDSNTAPKMVVNNESNNLGLKLLYAKINSEKGAVEFSVVRNLAKGSKTIDDFDINDGLTNLIYAYAKKDTDKKMVYQGSHVGSFLVSLWQPDMILEQFWNITSVAFLGTRQITDEKGVVQFSLDYYTDINSKKVLFHFYAPTQGWIGIGISSIHQGMSGSSMVVGFYNQTSALNEMRTYIGAPDPVPVLDPSTNHTLAYGIHHGSHYNSIQKANHFWYSRNFQEGNHAEEITSEKSYEFIWAYSQSNIFDYHGEEVNKTHGILYDMNLFENHIIKPAPPAPPKPWSPTAKKVLLYGHGVSMTIAWAILSTMGIFVARFTKNYWPRGWIRLHMGIFLLVLICFVVGFLLILAHHGWTLTVHNPHTMIGFMMFLGVFIQPMIGLLADRLYDSSRSSTPVFPDQIHWYLGRLLYIMGLYNVYLGLELVNAHFAFKVAYYFWVSLIIGILVFNKQPDDYKTNTGSSINDSTFSIEEKKRLIKKRDYTSL